MGVAGNVGDGNNYGVFGQLLGNNSGAGVFGSAYESDCGITGKYAGYFNGDVRVIGHLYVPSGEVFGTSDKNSKKDIVNLDNDNISRLKKISGIKFKYKTKSEMGLANSDSSKQNDIDIQNKVYIGVIAQDVQQVYPELVKTDQNGLLAVNYIGFIPILIESVKDLQKQVDNKDTKLANQQVDINDLKQQIADLQAVVAGCCASKSKLKSNAETENASILAPTTALLYQNSPNPFKENTYIKLDLPQTVAKSLLNIYDLTGKQLKSITIAERGTVTITINAKDLVAGMYHYALITDGNLIDIKTMILTE